jgi:hypothetical protein
MSARIPGDARATVIASFSRATERRRYTIASPMYLSSVPPSALGIPVIAGRYSFNMLARSAAAAA